jgi:enoyl-CoA hydratase
MSGDAELVVDRRGHTLVARLNRPEARNALTPTLIGALGAALREGETDPDVRVVVITGTGDRAFCAGMDLRAFAEDGFELADDGDTDAYVRLLRGRVEVPVVGAANATAVAGGLEVLLGCDLVVAADGATFGVPEVKRGLIAAGGGVFLGNRVPLSVALELVLTGDPIDARRALAIGLVNAVVPAADVLDVALGYADRIAANGPLAVRVTKELAYLGVADLDAAWRRLAELQPEVFASEDATEGARAFVEKRAPVWRGR